jgi:tether containing UBX domain for GLUT4
LFYEIPVLQILERELSSFTDLQKSLAQLGFNSGNVLIRLSFRRTEDPLDVAMTKIAEYFKTPEDEMPAPTPNQAPASSGEEATDEARLQTINAPQPEISASSADDQDTPIPDAPEQSASASTSERPITVFSPPSANIPSSAQIPYNEEDYVPSIEHAKAHQRLLNQSSRPQRLPTDAEIAAKAAAEEKRRSEIREVDVKVRFPDQSQVVVKFGPSDTGKSLYGFVRSCLAPAFVGEKFNLNIFRNPTASRPANASTLPESDQTLIKDLGLAGRVLVNFTWADGASSTQRRTDLLRPDLRSQAQELKVEQPPEPKEEPPAPKTDADPSGSGDGKPGGARKSGGMPKWLKLPGKK